MVEGRVVVRGVWAWWWRRGVGRRRCEIKCYCTTMHRRHPMHHLRPCITSIATTTSTTTTTTRAHLRVAPPAPAVFNIVNWECVSSPLVIFCPAVVGATFAFRSGPGDGRGPGIGSAVVRGTGDGSAVARLVIVTGTGDGSAVARSFAAGTGDGMASFRRRYSATVSGDGEASSRMCAAGLYSLGSLTATCPAAI